MTGTVSILAREFFARREVLLVAAAVAVLAFLMPLMPGLGGYRIDDVWTVASNTLALAVGWGLALLFGATVFGRDLSERRLGFYFARPVSGLAVWRGRMLAAYLLVLACEAVALVPSLVGGIKVIVSGDDWGWPAVAGYLVVPLVLLLLAHAVSIMVRARTVWLILDVTGFAVFPVVAWTSLRPLLVMGAEAAWWVVVGALALALLLSLGVAGAVGLAAGRVDLPRTHRALSLVLWGTLAVGVTGIAWYSHWLRDIGPPDFDGVDIVSVAPGGHWVEVFGYSRGRLDVRRRCLVSTIDGRWIPLPEQRRGYPQDVHYSADGSTALWGGKGIRDEPRALWWANLRNPTSSPQQTNLVVPPGANLSLSADGDSVAILEAETLSIFDLSKERLVKAVRLPKGLDRVTVLFPTKEILHLFARTGRGHDQSLILFEVQVATGRIVRTGIIGDVGDQPVFVVDDAVDHLVVHTRREEGQAIQNRVCDARNGSMVSELSAIGLPLFLRDGRLVSLYTDNRGMTSLVVESVASRKRTVHLIGRGQWPTLVGEVIPNGVVVSRLEDSAERAQGKRIDIVDVDSGEIRNIGRHLRGVLFQRSWQHGSAGAFLWCHDPSGATLLFLNQNGSLLRWNPEPSELVHVIGSEDPA